MTDTSDAVETFEADGGEETYSGDRVVAWEEGRPVRESDIDRPLGTDVVTAGAGLLGAPSDRSGAARVYVDDEAAAQVNTAEVPDKAADVVAWIREAENDETEAARRAGLAWSVEAARSDGVRATVEAEVDKYLTAVDAPPAPPADS